MKFRLGFFLGAAAAAVIVTNMSATQRQRLRDTASSVTSKVSSTVSSSDTAAQLGDVVSMADQAAAGVIDDVTPDAAPASTHDSAGAGTPSPAV